MYMYMGMHMYMRQVMGGGCSADRDSYDRYACSWRKFGITKINRYRVTIKATDTAFRSWDPDLPPDIPGHQFSRYVAFDWGQVRGLQGFQLSLDYWPSAVSHLPTLTFDL